jgi:hypothetical protein
MPRPRTHPASLRALVSGVALVAYVALVAGCGSTAVHKAEIPQGSPTVRLVRPSMLPSPVAARWALDGASLEVRVAWAQTCVREQHQEVRERETRVWTGSTAGNTAWGVVGLAIAAVGGYVAFVDAPTRSDERQCDGTKDCSSPRTNARVVGGVLLGTGLVQTVLASVLLAQGTNTMTRDGPVRQRTTSEPSACGRVEQLAGTEIVLIAPALGDPRGTLDERGFATLALPARPEGAPPTAPLEIMRVGPGASDLLGEGTRLGRVDLAPYRAGAISPR